METRHSDIQEASLDDSRGENYDKCLWIRVEAGVFVPNHAGFHFPTLTGSTLFRQAPGEAEAELAYLNRVDVIDGILSDDVDNFLFGALTVIRKYARLYLSKRSGSLKPPLP